MALRGATITRLTAGALIFASAVADAASAQTAPPPVAADQQQPSPPPSAPQNPLPAPASVPAAAEVQSCLQETGDYVTKGKATTFVIGLTNTCAKRIKCTIDAYVVGAKGPASGHAIMTLGAQVSGAAATKTYTMKVKAAGGTAQVSRDCRFL